MICQPSLLDNSWVYLTHIYICLVLEIAILDH